MGLTLIFLIVSRAVSLLGLSGRVPAVPAQGILALDLFTADLLTETKVYILAVIEHGTRRIHVRGAT